LFRGGEKGACRIRKKFWLGYEGGEGKAKPDFSRRAPHTALVKVHVRQDAEQSFWGSRMLNSREEKGVTG